MWKGGTSMQRRQACNRALFVTIVAALVTTCSTEVTADSGASLHILLACNQPDGQIVNLDPHVVESRDGQATKHEVGLHQGGAWADTHWHGRGSLGEAPYMRVKSAPARQQKTTITLSTGHAGEYHIFVMKPQGVPFPKSCSISVQGVVDSAGSNVPLGNIPVSTATGASVCLKHDDMIAASCDYWEAGHLRCSENSCELHRINRITARDPATGRPTTA